MYVFCVLAGRNQAILGETDIRFTLDNNFSGVFTRKASTDVDYEYNALAYSNSSLSNGPHELKITCGRVGGPRAIILLDRIVYS